MPSENAFLRSLPPNDLAAVTPLLRRMTLNRDEILAEEGRPVAYAYLPISSIISVITLMRDGRAVETRTIGREGGFGLLHALGSRKSFERVIVQVGGEAHRLPLEALRAAAEQRPSLVRCLVHHEQATLVQTARATACNALHGAEERLCRWLLMTQDRLGSDVLPLTQEHLAIMLAVQRTTVTAIAGELQEAGLISYSRGRIRILDRPRLERCACECYRLLSQAADDILSDVD